MEKYKMKYKMKYKSKLFFLLIILTGYNVYSQDRNDGIFSYSWGDMGIGYNNSTDNEIKNFEVNLSFANLFFEYPNFRDDPKVRIGIKLSPFNLRVLPWDKTCTMSFANADIFARFSFDVDSIHFGPFASINWLLFEKTFDLEFYIFSAGLRFTLLQWLDSHVHRWHLINFDLGYRRINNTNNIYFTMKLDLISYIAPFTLFLRDDE
jgi:hypothetical protein